MKIRRKDEKGRFVANTVEVLLKTIEIDSRTGCHNWIGGKNRQGYGITSWNAKNAFVHRVLYCELVGDIPEGLVVRHTCHNPSCVNPNHLCLGTSKDNSQDMVNANRQAKGERNSNSRLTEDQVFAIKDHIQQGRSYAEIGRQYGVSDITIGLIGRGRAWKHIAPEKNVELLEWKGETVPMAKLTTQAVKTIRQSHTEGLSYTVLARQYGVTKQAIAAIVHRKTWKHVD